MFNAIDELTKLGFVVHPKSESLLTLTREGSDTEVLVVEQDRMPSPAQLKKFSNSGDDDEVTLFVVTRTSKRGLERVAMTPGVALFAADGKSYFPGISSKTAVEPQRARGRTPWGKYALMRALMRTDKPRTQVELAQEAGLTQASVSMMLQKLSEHAHRAPAGWVPVNREEIWNEFLATYPGAARVSTYWYSRHTFAKRAMKLGDVALLSGDGAADQLAPWRSPERLIAYAETPVDMSQLGFASATSSEANIEFAIPVDQTVFSTARPWGQGVVDPAIAAWDLARAGGAAVDESIEKLKALMLGGRGDGDDH